MKFRKIVMAGGNGYLGTVLAKYFNSLADEIILLSRKPAASNGNIKTLVWDGETAGEWASALNRADLLINLCGKNVNCRYTETNKAEIIRSRVIPTALLGKVIGTLSDPPKLWINLASATIYRHAEDHTQDEATGEIGYGFSIEVCRQWEQSFFDAQTPFTRKIALRHGIALGRSDSVFPRLLNFGKARYGRQTGRRRTIYSLDPRV